MNKENKKALKAVATAQILINGKTTNLEIKNQLRNEFPDESWTQPEISKEMRKLAEKNIFTFEDSGVYRTYTITDDRVKIKLSRTKVISALKDSKGSFLTVVFTKKDNTTRMVNGHINKDNFLTDLGYVRLVTGQNDIKLIDPRKIISVKTKNLDLIVK